jgi:hypothetical protein
VPLGSAAAIVTIKTKSGDIEKKYFATKNVIRGCKKFFKPVKINECFRSLAILKPAKANPEANKTAGKAILDIGIKIISK